MQEDLIHEYDNKISKLESQTQQLLVENGILKDSLQKTQISLDAERENMKKTV